jgi:hypothetical protein
MAEGINSAHGFSGGSPLSFPTGRILTGLRPGANVAARQTFVGPSDNFNNGVALMAEPAYHKFRAERAPAPRGCPVDRVFSTFSETYVANPYEVLEKLRGKSAVFYAEKLGYLVLTRMAEVAEVFRKPDTFSAENV